MRMNFKFTKEDYLLVKKYGEFDEMDYIIFDDSKCEIEIKDEELCLFEILISDMATTYGLDSNGEITDFGRKLEAIYDTIYYQS